MATKNSTGRRARKAKCTAATPARTLLNNPPAAPALLPNYHSLLNGLLNVRGVVRMAAAAVYCNTNDKPRGRVPALQDADGGLTLALREIERIYALMDEPAVRDLWETRRAREGEIDA